MPETFQLDKYISYQHEYLQHLRDEYMEATAWVIKEPGSWELVSPLGVVLTLNLSDQSSEVVQWRQQKILQLPPRATPSDIPSHLVHEQLSRYLLEKIQYRISRDMQYLHRDIVHQVKNDIIKKTAH